MGKNWYVIHTYAGFEGRVKSSIMERANQMGLVEQLGQVLVPTEDVIEIKDGKRRTSRRKFFPGYVLVELETPLTDETAQMRQIQPIALQRIDGGGNERYQDRYADEQCRQAQEVRQQVPAAQLRRASCLRIGLEQLQHTHGDDGLSVRGLPPARRGWSRADSLSWYGGTGAMREH